MQKSGDKKIVVFRQIAPDGSIIQPFGIPIGRFQNLLNKALRKSWMLGYFKCEVNVKVAKIVKLQAHGGGGGVSTHLLSVKSIKIEKERGACQIKLFKGV